jgi:uncharacterized protein (TIGR02996 family)
MALLEAMHADPRNDAPRLDYARWLEEHGEDVLRSSGDTIPNPKPSVMRGRLGRHSSI